MTNLTNLQKETIINVENLIIKEFSVYKEKVNISSYDIILESIALHTVLVEIQKTGINHVYGFWVSPNGTVIKVQK